MKLTPLQLALQTASAAQRREKEQWDNDHPPCGRCGDPKPMPRSDERETVHCVRWCECGLPGARRENPVGQWEGVDTQKDL
jgi:hypothetical protein